MDAQRRKTIVDEINHWRKNQLLPEHYCIFLLNLYTEGELPPRPEITVSAKRSASGSDRDGSTAYRTGTSGNTRSQKGGYETETAPYGSKEGFRYPAEQAGTVSWKMLFAWLGTATVIAVMILLAFHFNGFTTPMQITILTAGILFFYVLSFIVRRRAPVFTHATLGASFLLLIIAGFFSCGSGNFPTRPCWHFWP
ncbi:hypothetical protein LOK74_11995 [Brevibacillus humidisoli]|uniref:hypothetical protein n=1 Tax=Brevibacillus humidisoli TaxID=2895522 RepID=UPI001E5025F1|nr:hypothetical protein [Brevibacillus humidisoli]UFJ43139.1 hypothetical protein LOK74_11995 [Brevibacillus humidisoli]